MRTIRKVFGENLRRLRGERTQVQMAELLDLEASTYQRLEAGQIPQAKTIDKITAKLAVSEVELYQDPEWHPRPTPREALAVLADMVENEAKRRQAILDEAQALLDARKPKPQKAIGDDTDEEE